MTRGIMMIIACAIQLGTALLAYQYLTHRGDGACGTKAIFQPKYDLVSLIVVLIAFLASAFIFISGFLWNGEGFMRSLMNAEVMIWLSVLGYIDAREKIIPNCLIGVGLLFWPILAMLDIFLGGTPWIQLLVFSGIGGFVCGGVLMVIALIMKSGLGMGDVKMFFVLGLLYGLTDTYGIFLFTIIPMGLFCIALLLLKKATRKTTIPMAPFVVVGFILSIIAGM